MGRYRSYKKQVSGQNVQKHWRISALVFLVFFLASFLVGRLAFLQIVRQKDYRAIAEGQRMASRTLPSDRGEIFMRDNGNIYPVAVNRKYSLAYAVPFDIPDVRGVAEKVSHLLGVPQSILEERFSKREDPFEIIRRRLSDDESEKLRNAHLPGIGLLPEQYRYYPGGVLAAQTIGFVGMTGDASKGRYGIESSFEDELRGEMGTISDERDAAGRWIPLSDRNFHSPTHGANIVLTLERVIQYEVERMLSDAVAQFKADGGTIIVVDPKTGSILALASLPNFDPNEYSKVENPSLFLNPAVSLSYEPGSIMKPITMAIGIEDGKVHASTEYVDTGVVMEGGYAIRNAEGKVYGRSSMTKVLEDSINTGVIHVERLVGNETFRSYLGRFGFGVPTGIDLPAEAAGNVRNLENPRRSTEFYTAAFGQGITATPLQMVFSYATLANKGMLMQPRIVDRILYSDGRIEEMAPKEVRLVVSEATAGEVGAMLRSVVVHGHGKRADVPGYEVVGKTGTAQVAKQGERGYEEGKNIGSFVGYAPLSDPKFVVLVKIDNPHDVVWAESSAAPTFGRVMKFLLEQANIDSKPAIRQ